MFTDPVKNLNLLGITDNMVVADLGAGSGFYSVAVAKLVPNGKVYAVEIIPDFVKSLRHKIKERNLHNVECILGNVEKIGGTKIKEDTIDRIIASNVLFQIEDKNLFLDEMKRILHPNGKVLLIDWSKDESALGKNLPTALSKEEVKILFERKGFKFEREIDVGLHHYGIIYSK